MDKKYTVLEKSKSIEILVALYDENKMFLSELLIKLKTKDTNTINRRIDTLRDAGLINDETEAKFGGRRYIWLTKKGEKIARLLFEVKQLF
jgi:DNA-binding HxlR family transcriptional regulator